MSKKIIFMIFAIYAAKKAEKLGEVPVGALVVRNNKIISIAHNLVRTYNNATAHAEMLAIKKASESTGAYNLSDCEIFTSLEPCAMCAHAISLSRIKHITFGAYDEKSGGLVNGARVLEHSHHKPTIEGGIMKKECSKIMSDFFKKIRAKKNKNN